MVIELVFFKAVAGTSRSSLDAAIADSTRFLTQQPGFIRRSVGIDQSDLITDIVHWESME